MVFFLCDITSKVEPGELSPRLHHMCVFFFFGSSSGASPLQVAYSLILRCAQVIPSGFALRSYRNRAPAYPSYVTSRDAIIFVCVLLFYRALIRQPPSSAGSWGIPHIVCLLLSRVHTCHGLISGGGWWGTTQRVVPHPILSQGFPKSKTRSRFA